MGITPFFRKLFGFSFDFLETDNVGLQFLDKRQEEALAVYSTYTVYVPGDDSHVSIVRQKGKWFDP